MYGLCTRQWQGMGLVFTRWLFNLNLAPFGSISSKSQCFFWTSQLEFWLGELGLLRSLKTLPFTGTGTARMPVPSTEGRFKVNFDGTTSFSACAISVHNGDSVAFQYLPPCRHIEALHEDGIPYAPLSVKSVYLRSWPRINKAAWWFPWVYAIWLNYWCIILAADATFPHIKGKKISEQ